MMFSKELFSSRLAHLRSKKGAKLKEIGASIGITEASMSRLEAGKISPSLDTLIALANYFDVSLDFLVGRSDKPERDK